MRRRLTGVLGFRRGAALGVVVSGVAVLLGEGEDADEEQGNEASMLARLEGSRGPGAHAIVHRRSCCGRELRVVVALLGKRCNQALNVVSRVRKEKGKLEVGDGWQEGVDARQNRRRELPVPAGFEEEIRRPGASLVREIERGERDRGGLFIGA
jgi:hypothetical protein